MTPFLQARNVAVHANGQPLVEPTDLALFAGRSFTILGETGSGKSLLAQALIGTLPKTLRATGEVLVAGKTFDLTQPEAQSALWGKTIAILPQEPWLALDPLMSAREQIAEGHALVGKTTWPLARRRADDNLLKLGLAGAGERLPHQLSGGMAQRVAFAAARTGGARLLIADEPTKGLDIARRDDVIALLKREMESGGALLTITHDIELARKLGGEVAVVLEGRIIERGEAIDVLSNPQDGYTRRLVFADPSSWATPNAFVPGGEPVLTAKGLAVSRGGRELFSGLDITLRRGEILGIFGPSGCGKSTLGDSLLGLKRPNRGVVSRSSDFAARQFQKLYQDPPSAFPPDLRLGQALEDVIRLHHIDAQRIPLLLGRLRLPPALLNRRPDAVSGGELQRLSLLRALLLDPVLLFADEPTSRLDLITQSEVISLLKEVARENGMALLLVSHDLTLLEKTADHVLTLEQAEAEPQFHEAHAQ